MSAGELAPAFGIVHAEWTQNEDQTGLFANNGAAGILEIGDPFWTIDIKVVITSRAQFDEWDSFLARRGLRDLSFTMPRSLRRRPRDAGITSDAGLGVAGISAAASTVSFSGYGAGRQAHYGDMVGYRTLASGYWIGQVMAPATADGSGNITVSVWPRPVTPHASAPQPRRIDALGEFRLSKRPGKKEAWNDWDFSFQAEQVLR